MLNFIFCGEVYEISLVKSVFIKVGSFGFLAWGVNCFHLKIYDKGIVQNSLNHMSITKKLFLG